MSESESESESRAVTRLVTAEEREEAVRLLTSGFASDTLSVDEFERRVAEVYRAESPQALQKITADLPAATPDATSSAVPARVDSPTDIARRPSSQIASVLSAVERSVQGPMPECLEVRSTVGSLELDLRRADFPPGVTEIRIRSLLGNIEIELPEHVRVENEGHAFLGSFSVRGRSRARGDDSAPVVRITGRAILANVEVELDD